MSEKIKSKRDNILKTQNLLDLMKNKIQNQETRVFERG